jgi:hypothetical protein
MPVLTKNTNTNPSHSSSHYDKGKESFFGIQAKLNIGKSNDKFEVEADRVADQVVTNKQMPKTDSFFSPSPVMQKKLVHDVQKQEEQIKKNQRKTAVETSTSAVQFKEELIQNRLDSRITEKREPNPAFSSKTFIQNKFDDKVQKKEETIQNKTATKKTQTVSKNIPSVKPTIQNKGEEENLQQKKEEERQTSDDEKQIQKSAGTDSNPGDNSNIESRLNSSKGGGSPLSGKVKTEMESGIGADFSNVRIHNDSNAVQMNKQLGAQAFATGNNIYFNEGKYNPNSQEGKHLLAHELTHTVQQGSTQPAIQKKEEEPNNSTAATDTTQKNTSSEDTPKSVSDKTDSNTQRTGANQITFDPNSSSANQSVSSPTNTAQNQSAAGSTSETTSESTQETSTESEGGVSVNQSADAGTSGSDSSSGTSSSTTSSSETTSSSSSAGGETTGGFASYDLFLAYVEEKKQASAIYFKNKKQELTDGINEEKRKNKETVEAEIDRLKETKRATIEKINQSHEQTTNAINTKRDTEIQNARDVAEAEIARVDQVILTKTELITSIAENKAETVISAGNEQSTQALITTSNNVRQVDAIIRQKQSQYSGKDNAGDVVQAAWSSKSETVQKIQESGNAVSSEVINHSIKLADNYRTEAINVSSEFRNKRQEAVDAINARRDEVIKAVTDAAKESLTGLDEQTTSLKSELETSVSSQLSILEQIPEKIDTELDDVLSICLGKVTENEAITIQEIDKFKTNIAEIYWYNEEVTAAQNDLGKAIDEHYTDVDKFITDVIKKVTDVSTEFKTEFTSSLNTINSALSETANGYKESTDNLKTETINTIDENARTAETETKIIADEVDSGLQEEINTSETRWNSQLTEDVTNMRETVSEALIHQTGILNQFRANLDEEFNRSPSWWDTVTDFLSGMVAGLWEGLVSLGEAILKAMGTLIFWIIIAAIVLIIVILVVKFGIALALILKVILVIGIIVGVLFAIYYFYRAFATEGLSPYERGRLFGRGLFEIGLALIGAGVYTRVAGWVARIARITSIIARVGSLARFLRIIVLVEDVKAFIALLDRMADIERLLLLMEKIKDVKALIKLLSSAPDAGRIIEALLNVGKADELLQILTKADDIGRVLSLIESGIRLGHAESLITILSKAKELAKLITVLERAGNDIGRAIQALSSAPDLDKMIIAMERVGTSDLGRFITLLLTVDDLAALVRVVTKAADFATALRLIEEATEINKIVALFDQVIELDKLIISFDSFGNTNRLLATFNGVTEVERLVSVLAQSSALDRLVPFLEGLADINAALPKMQALAGELDDFVRFLDEAGMTVGKLEKLLHMENLTVAKLRNLLTQAGGVVDDLIKVLDEIKDLDKLTNFINHFGNFADVMTIVKKGLDNGLSRASGSTFILDFLEACTIHRFKKIDKIVNFFDRVAGSGAASKWQNGLQYAINLANECLGTSNLNVPARGVAGTGQVGSKSFMIADGSSVLVTIENADIAHIAAGHTWKYFFVNSFANIESRVSMFDLGTDVAELENLARSLLNSPELEAVIGTLNRTDVRQGAMASSHQMWVSLDNVRGVLSLYPQGSAGIQIDGKLMKAVVTLWQSI